MMARPPAAADGIVEDRGIYPGMLTLQACLEQELIASGLPVGCVKTLMPGDQNYGDCGECDDGSCGSAWVRLVRAFPSVTFPNQEAGNATCASPLAYELEVAVVRCVETIREDGTGPDAATLLAQTRTQLADMAAMRRAIACCFGTGDTEYALGAYTPGPFVGGCGGGAWTVVTRTI